MPEINLLPQELKPSGYAVKISKRLKQFSILSVVFVLVVSIAYTVANIFLSFQGKTLTVKQEKLKNEIKILEQTEQKLVLVKDRLTGIEKIVSNNSAREELEVLQTIIEKNPQNIKIDGAKLVNDQVVLSVSANSSSNITEFFSLLLSSKFSKIFLESFDYNPKNGYKVDIAISR